MSELTPVTRKEQFYDKILQAAESGGGGGGGSTLIEKSISANGVYNASDDSADGYSKVTVDVPNTYTAEDEGKVISNGSLVAQTTHAEITENGTYDITTNNSVSVNVSGGGVEFSSSPSNFTLLRNIRNLNVEIPKGVETIGPSAFDTCEGLISVEIPDTVATIENYAFNKCSGLTTIIIPNSVKTIKSTAFSNCNNLSSIVIDKIEDSILDSPWGATNATVIWKYKARYKTSINETSSSTSLTTSVSCTVGDLVVATFENLGGEYTLPSGWTLLGDSGAVSAGGFTQRTGMAYKIAENITESFTLTQASSGRMFTNLIAITGASIGTFSGFSKNETNNIITANKPQGLVIWTVSVLWWGTNWDVMPSNDKEKISYKRCENILDQSNDSTVMFVTDSSRTAGGLACASLTITGIDNFWYYDD